MISQQGKAMGEDTQLLVSVVIISYNGRKYLAHCLDSVLDQDFPREQYEVILVDNASQDGSADFVEQNYPAVRVLRLDHNYGPSVAMQRALPHLKGRYFAAINQDVTAHRRWLAELVGVITAEPQAGIVESNMILSQWPEYNELQRDAPVQRAYVCDLTPLGVHDFHVVAVTPNSPPIPVLSAYCAGFIMNPRIIEKLGYFVDPGLFAYFDDIDLGLRLNAAGYKVLLAPRSLVYHDTEWHFKWNMRSVRRAFWSTRNMILVFYKVSYTSEFLRLLPQLLVGKLVKAGQHARSPVAKVALALAGTPLLLVGLAAALVKMPGYRELRRITLSHRVMPRGWLVDRLRNADWQPDQTVWAGRSAVVGG